MTVSSEQSPANTRSAGGFAPGTLLELVAERSRAAITSGAQLPIATEAEVLEDGGIPFLVRQLTGQKRKMAARSRQSSEGTDPFLPYDDDMFVADLSGTHVCLLNKFNIVPNHVLVVTRAFEPQSAPVSREDLTALWTVLREIDGLGFYNSERLSGASQPHKHLQMAPLPLACGGPPTPIDALLDAGGTPPFAHALARIDWPPDLAAATAGTRLAERIGGLQRQLGLAERPGAHNLLVTRRWVMWVPRRRASWQGVQANAMGFAGTLLVRTPEERKTLERIGPLSVLRHTAGRTERNPATPGASESR